MASFANTRAPGGDLAWSALRHLVAGLALLVVVAGVGGSLAGAVVPFAVQSIALYLAVAVAMAGHLHAHRPARDFGGANRLTLVRLVATCLLAGYIGRWAAAADAGWPLTVIAAAALVLDGIDGWWARRERTASPFGARFDMEVDALLILVLAILAWGLDKAGAWVLAAGLARYLFVSAGWVMPWLRASLPPRRRRRAVCAIQAGVLAGCLAPILGAAITVPLAALAVTLTLWSFAADIVWLYRNQQTGDVPS